MTHGVGSGLEAGMVSHLEKPRKTVSIWWFAFAYFAAYAPYSALTKALSPPGLLAGMDGRGFAGFQLLPITAMASMIGMFIFITSMKWWKYAGRKTIMGLSFPCPSKYTFLSGLCTATIIPTTTLAYTFDGLSIVFMMLLMRGGVLIIAPMVDFVCKRKVRVWSWVALGLSLMALLVSLVDVDSYHLTLVAALDVIIYLGAYFFRLRFMSKLAKSNDENARTKFFVEEQMTATPMLVTFLALIAIVGALLAPESLSVSCALTAQPTPFKFFIISKTISCGFTSFFTSPYLVYALIVGFLSQGTGIFGGLVLLDKRENTFCVPVNRVSSIMSGLLATLFLCVFLDAKPPSVSQLIGAALIVGAIAALSLPDLIGKWLKARRSASGETKELETETALEAGEAAVQGSSSDVAES